jgi:hypothetical protein
MNTTFRSHGTFTIRVDGPIIISDVVGPWNKELVEAWGKQVHPFIKELAAAGPNAGIAIVHESMMCPADALASLRLLVQYSATKMNCVSNVIVASRDTLGRDLLEATFARIYEGVIAYRLFDNLDEAMAWTKEQLEKAQ